MSKQSEEVENIKPYNQLDSKGNQVEAMFDSIAPAYDLMNNIMSLWMHIHWRNKALKMAIGRHRKPIKDVLDVATGTGEVVLALADLLPASKICGLDLSEGMLEKARQKVDKLSPLDRHRISFFQGDCLALPFEDNSFDLITVAYGVRNFENIKQGYKEMYRVLRPGGIICVIELCCPTAGLPLAFYHLYTRNLIPIAGKLISGDSKAYSYLHESIEATPQRGEMEKILKETGFGKTEWKDIRPGVVCIYIGEK